MPYQPWTAPAQAPSAEQPPNYAPPETNRYTVPSPGAPYVAGGWSPTLRDVPGGTPDPGRLGTMPLYQEYPTPNRPPGEWYAANNGDIERRNTVQVIDATGWNEEVGADGSARFAPNPRSTPPMPSRWTATLSPNSYSFWRHMGTGQPKDTPRALNGVHFSMADHRRDYPILGMSAQRKPGAGTRNTYRLAPAPWDSSIIDVPPPTANGLPAAELQAPTLASSLSRSGRLM